MICQCQQPAVDKTVSRWSVMPLLHVKYNYFKIISAFVSIHLK